MGGTRGRAQTDGDGDCKMLIAMQWASEMKYSGLLHHTLSFAHALNAHVANRAQCTEILFLLLSLSDHSNEGCTRCYVTNLHDDGSGSVRRDALRKWAGRQADTMDEGEEEQRPSSSRERTIAAQVVVVIAFSRKLQWMFPQRAQNYGLRRKISNKGFFLASLTGESLREIRD